MEKFVYDTNPLISLLKSGKHNAKGSQPYSTKEFPKAIDLKALSNPPAN